MSRPKCLLGIALASAVLMSSLCVNEAHANRESAPEPTAEQVDRAMAEATDIQAYIDERSEIMRLVRMGEFGRLQRRDMRELNSAWSQLQSLLEGHDQISEMSSSDKLKVYNAQQVFDAIISRQRLNGLVCTRSAPTGSRIDRTRCMTVAEREAQREANQNAFRTLQGPTCVPGNGGRDGGNC